MLNKILFLFEVDFNLYPDQKISAEAKKIFERNIAKYYWSVSQEGKIINARFENFPRKDMVVNTEDERTVESLNLLPKLFSRTLSGSQKKNWRIQVYYSKHDETDHIIIINEELHLQDYYISWQKEHNNFNALMKEVSKIQDLI